jgi:hypothetical protein
VPAAPGRAGRRSVRVRRPPPHHSSPAAWPPAAGRGAGAAVCMRGAHGLCCHGL